MPLTASTPKPLVRFGSQGSIIDYTLYNCLDSKASNVLVLTQYLAYMVEKYINNNWTEAFSNTGRRIRSISAKRLGKNSYDGTADAVYQVLHSLDKLPDCVVVLAADHIYKMDYRKMIEFHQSGNNTATVGCIECEPTQAYRFGIMNINDDFTVDGFFEKPKDPQLFNDRQSLLASMGIYVFNSDALMEYLIQNQKEQSHDFGHDIIPMMVKKGDARAFQYKDNNGSKPYWRDVGDLSAYWQAHMELIKNDHDLLNFSPVAGLKQLPFSRKDIILKHDIETYKVFQSSIAHTAHIGHAVIKNSIVCPGVRVEDGVNISNSVLLDGSKVAAGVDISDSLVMPRTRVFSKGQYNIHIAGSR